MWASQRNVWILRSKYSRLNTKKQTDRDRDRSVVSGRLASQPLLYPQPIQPSASFFVERCALIPNWRGDGAKGPNDSSVLCTTSCVFARRGRCVTTELSHRVRGVTLLSLFLAASWQHSPSPADESVVFCAHDCSINSALCRRHSDDSARIQCLESKWETSSAVLSAELIMIPSEA